MLSAHTRSREKGKHRGNDMSTLQQPGLIHIVSTHGLTLKLNVVSSVSLTSLLLSVFWPQKNTGETFGMRETEASVRGK